MLSLKNCYRNNFLKRTVIGKDLTAQNVNTYFTDIRLKPASKVEKSVANFKSCINSEMLMLFKKSH